MFHAFSCTTQKKTTLYFSDTKYSTIKNKVNKNAPENTGNALVFKLMPLQAFVESPTVM